MTNYEITGSGGLVDDRAGNVHTPDPSWGFSGGTYFDTPMWRLVTGEPSAMMAPRVRMAIIEHKRWGVSLTFFGRDAVKVMEICDQKKMPDLKYYFMASLQMRIPPNDLHDIMEAIHGSSYNSGFADGKEEVQSGIRKVLGLEEGGR